MNNSCTKYFLFIAFLTGLLLSSCSTTKHNPGKNLLIKTSFSYDSDNLDYYDLDALIRQHQNRRFLGARLHAGVYTMGSLLKDKTEEKVKRINEKDQRKLARNPDYEIDDQKNARKANRTLRTILMQKIGEEPVFLDSLQTAQSVHQMTLYCKKHGYFNASVTDSVYYTRKKKKAKVFYTVKAGTPYTINNVDFISSDPNINSYLSSRKAESKIVSGAIFDEDVLEDERLLINTELKNMGYFAFSQSYIRYEVDTTIGDKKLNIKLVVNRPYRSGKTQGDSTVFYNHQKYQIRNLYVLPDFEISKETQTKYDTLLYVKTARNKQSSDTLCFLTYQKMRVKPKVIARKTFIKPGHFFSLAAANKTQVELSSLNVFKYINIRFVPDTTGMKDNSHIPLDAYIELSQFPVQSINAEIEGTNSSGNLGTAGNLVYKNKNLFHGAELFNFKFKGGLELQKTIFDDENDVISGLPFNSAEVSTEANLSIPVSNRYFSQSSHPLLKFSTGFSYQLRPDYERYISHLKASLEWRETATRIWQVYFPINLVRILPDSLFAERISQFSRTIRYSYEDHFIPGFGISIISNNQTKRKNRPYTFWKFNFEQAGLLLWLGNNTNHWQDGEVIRVLGINYSQYQKYELDLRHYHPWPNKTMMVYRTFLGIGNPNGNSAMLPFEKSYSASGSNDIRAWKFRSLGPGTYIDPDSSNFDRTGDISFVLNLEYRFPIISWFNGALFVDAGNVWLKNASDEFPGGEIHIPECFEQFAIGAGFGLRLDFDFFIFRIDGALKMRDPAKPEGERWVGFEKPVGANLSFGIGYPF